MKSLLLRCAALLAAAIAFAPAFADAAPDDSQDLLPVEQAYLVTATAPGRDRIEVHFHIVDGYYLYRGKTRLSVQGGGFAAADAQLPAGIQHHDDYLGDVETWRGDIVAVLPGKADANAGNVSLQVKYQGCADAGVCFPPQTRTLEVKLPAAVPADATTPSPAQGEGSQKPLFGAAQGAGMDKPLLPAEQAYKFEAIPGDAGEVLMRFTMAPGYYLYRDRSHFSVSGADGIAAGTPLWPQGVTHHDENFGDQVVYYNQIDVPLPLQRSNGNAAHISVEAKFQGCQDEGVCYPPMTRTIAVDLPASSPSTGPSSSGAKQSGGIGLWGALLFGLLGGLILNLMPCVLPVLSLKVLGVAQSGESLAHARKHALWYTAGVMLSFAAVGGLVLALRAGGQALGWGFQLQQPGVVAVLVYLMFAVGLSLSGVFQFNLSVGQTGSALVSKSGAAGDFFTGVLACVVASPCIAPFMGGALGYAFSSGALAALAVFLALGLGLALPFLLIGFVPALAKLLPKPGAWMETLKQFLAFPMYLTAAWLLWVLGKQRGVDAMALVAAGLAVFALGLWWFERKRWTAWRFAALLVALVALWPATQVGKLQPAAKTATAANSVQQPWSPEKLAELRAQNKVVFVDMTADWCVTCKANERHVLSQPGFAQALKAHDAVYLVGDWTDSDPKISAFLAQYKAVGVPLYVVFPRNGGEGEVLPQLLSEKIVDDALDRAAR